MTKANQALAMLKRNIKPKIIKDKTDKSLVRPQLEFTSSVWTHGSKYLINKIEKINVEPQDM